MFKMYAKPFSLSLSLYTANHYEYMHVYTYGFWNTYIADDNDKKAHMI